MERDPTCWVGLGIRHRRGGQLPGHDLENPKAFLSAWLPRCPGSVSQGSRIAPRGNEKAVSGAEGTLGQVQEFDSGGGRERRMRGPGKGGEGIQQEFGKPRTGSKATTGSQLLPF